MLFNLPEIFCEQWSHVQLTFGCNGIWFAVPVSVVDELLNKNCSSSDVIYANLCQFMLILLQLLRYTDSKQNIQI